MKTPSVFTECLAWTLCITLVPLFVVGAGGDAHLPHTSSSRQSQSVDFGQSTLDTLKLVLDSMDAGLEFMGTEHKKVNLDAVIGTRLVEGKIVIFIMVQYTVEFKFSECLFCSALFCFVLVYSVLFCSVLFCSVAVLSYYFIFLVHFTLL